jgi:D-threo-aldose 1-dehydrogenase
MEKELSSSSPTSQPAGIDLSNLPAMPKATLGRTGIVTTRIGLGTASWPTKITYEQTLNVLQTAFDCGIRHIDMAPFYGSEEIIGRALQELKKPADTVLATKSCSYLRDDPLNSSQNFSADTVYRSVERSLKRLGTDYIHIVHIHNVGVRHLPIILGEKGALSALLDLKSQGVIGSIGMAALALKVQLAAVECGEIDNIQAFHTYTLLNQTAKAELFPKAKAANLAVLNNAPYAGYILATGPVEGARYNYGIAKPEVIEAASRLAALCAQKGVSLPTAAVAFSYQEPDVDVTVIASGKPLHVISWVKDLAAPLTRADFDEMIQLAGFFPVE